MLYMSNDRKMVFENEQECCEYEQQIEQERINREKIEIEKHVKLEVINKKYEELQKLISEYSKSYGVKQKPYFAPFYELLDMLYG